MKSHANHQRLFYMDGVRAFALLLGVVFHASLSFMPSFIGWAVMDISTSEFISVFILVSHSFRMELFFLVAGFFSCMALQRQSASRFFSSRAVRLGIPFVVGWFLLRPLLVAAWVIGGQSMRGEVDFSSGFSAGFTDVMQLSSGLFTGTHLWFLYYLMAITLTFLLIRYVLAKLQIIETLNRLVNTLPANTASVLTVSAALVAITSFALWFMSAWGMDTPDKSLVPHLPTFAVYFLCFSVGWLLHNRSDIFHLFSQFSWALIVVVILAIVSTVYFSAFQGSYGTSNYNWYKCNFVMSYAVMMWGLVFASIAICKRVFAKAHRAVTYLSNASYWIYLIHLPIVLALQIAVAELEIGWLWKWAGVSIATIVISILSYELFVRKSPIGKVLNGNAHKDVAVKGKASENSSFEEESLNEKMRHT